MAEKAEYGVETLVHMLIDLEFIEKKEMRSIVSKIRSFEYNLQSVKKNKFNYIKYVSFLKMLILKIGKESKKKKNLNQVQIQNALGQKVKHLLLAAIHRWPNDLKLWFTLINFCQKLEFYESIEKAYAQMVQIHSDKEDVWALAAKWNFEVNHGHEVSRNLFQRGIRHLPKSKLLWNEYFKIELMMIDIIKKRKEILEKNDPINESNLNKKKDAQDVVLTGKIPLIVFKNAIKEIPEIDFAASFIQILDQFEDDLRIVLKKEIFQLIEEKYLDSEEKRNLLARKNFDPLFLMKTKRVKQETEIKLNKDSRIDKVNQEFKKAIQVFKNEKMWNFYIGFNLEVYEKVKNEKRKSRCFDLILQLMDQCWSLELMSKQLFLEWLYLLNQTSNYKKFDRILNYGHQKWPHDSTVWYHCLNSMLGKDISYRDEIKKLFSRALSQIVDHLNQSKCEENKKEQIDPIFKHCQIKSISDIWNLYIDWASTHLQPFEVVKIIEKGCSQNEIDNCLIQQKISSILKPLLLIRSSHLKKNGLQEARNYYHQFKNVSPFVENFFEQMLIIELNQPKCNVKFMRSIYEDYVKHFGKDNHHVWLNFCKFELEKGNPFNVGMLHFRACKMLNEQECDQFMSAYCLLQNFDK